MRKECTPENLPDWYWKGGLHDAGILSVELIDFPFDYQKYVEDKYKYDRSLMVLKIDAKGALYDKRVEEIRFYNYEILTPDVSLKNRKSLWWLDDRLFEQNNRYILEIDLEDCSSRPKRLTFTVKFERAEVQRQ